VRFDARNLVQDSVWQISTSPIWLELDTGTRHMREIGAFEAQNRLGSLLNRVEQAEEILITRRGKPEARLVPDSRTQLWRFRRIGGFIVAQHAGLFS